MAHGPQTAIWEASGEIVEIVLIERAVLAIRPAASFSIDNEFDRGIPAGLVVSPMASISSIH